MLRSSLKLAGIAAMATIMPLVLSGCSQGASAAVAASSPTIAGASAEHPVVLELFQSQGCSSCPPANANLNALADRPDILALSFAVTYWDQLGWKDTFGSPAWTARQWDYARAAGRPQVATPQVILNGRATLVGGNRAQLDAALAAAGPAHGGPALSAPIRQLRLSAGETVIPATIWLVRYDPQVREVPIRAGENGGRTLPHRDIVRSLDAIGTWHGAAEAIALPSPRRDGLAEAVLVQAGKGGAIIAATKIPTRM